MHRHRNARHVQVPASFNGGGVGGAQSARSMVGYYIGAAHGVAESGRYDTQQITANSLYPTRSSVTQWRSITALPSEHAATFRGQSSSEQTSSSTAAMRAASPQLAWAHVGKIIVALAEAQVESLTSRLQFANDWLSYRPTDDATLAMGISRVIGDGTASRGRSHRILIIAEA